MDPFSLAISAIGLGFNVFGSYKAKKAARQQAEAQQAQEARNAELNRQINAERLAQAEAVTSRYKRDVIRQAQAAESLALNNQADSGAGIFSSAAQGARGSILNSAEGLRVAADENLVRTRNISSLSSSLGTQSFQRDTTGQELQGIGNLLIGVSDKASKAGQTLFSFASEGKSLNPFSNESSVKPGLGGIE